MSERKTILLTIQLMLSVTGAALLLWELVTFVKSSVIGKLDVNTWVYIFFHPSESSLFNYVIVAAFLGACALCLYTGRLTSYVRNKSDGIGYLLLVASPILSLSGLGTTAFFFYRITPHCLCPHIRNSSDTLSDSIMEAGQTGALVRRLSRMSARLLLSDSFCAAS